MSQVQDDLRRRYAEALQRYVAAPDELQLQEAYEIGRTALTAGSGVLSLAALHHETLQEVVPPAPSESGPQSLGRAEEFFIESLMAFEMCLRSYREAIAALRHMNDRVELEAKRIAHSLHQEAGGLLATTHLALDEISRQMPQEAAEGVAELRSLLERVHDHLRRLSHELHPTILDDLGLLPALDYLTKGISGRGGLSITVEGSTDGRLLPEVETALYRNVQEALNNVVIHARATHVIVRLERKQGMIYCSVSDDGVGFNPRCTVEGEGERGLGLVGMRERLGSLRGILQVTSAPGKGSELTMQVPLGS